MAECKVEKAAEGPSKLKIRSICVFGEANLGKDGEFIKEANDLGKVLAARKISLVYGGGIHGLRACVATSAFLGGCKVWGVHVKDLVNKNGTYSSIGNELKVSSMPEQRGYMLYSAEAFIALPGGLETLDGISSIAHWTNLNFHKKPLGLLNVNGFYDSLLSFLDRAVEQGFIPQAIRHTIISASTANQLLDQLQSYAPEPEPLIKQIELQLSDSSEKDEVDTTLRL